jgi:hypothetical protein
MRKLAGECLNLNDETGGKMGLTPASRPGQSGKGESTGTWMRPMSNRKISFVTKKWRKQHLQRLYS